MAAIVGNLLKDCCTSPMKLYTKLTCRLCWRCISCRMSGCDKLMYQQDINRPKFVKPSSEAGLYKFLEDKFLETNFLEAYGVTESTERYERSGPGANPGRLKFFSRGPDCSVVVMKVRENTNVYVKEPTNVHVICSHPAVPHSFYRQQGMGEGMWTCRIGPIQKPLLTTITIDNKKMPLIVTE